MALVQAIFFTCTDGHVYGRTRVWTGDTTRGVPAKVSQNLRLGEGSELGTSPVGFVTDGAGGWGWHPGYQGEEVGGRHCT